MAPPPPPRSLARPAPPPLPLQPLAQLRSIPLANLAEMIFPRPPPPLLLPTTAIPFPHPIFLNPPPESRMQRFSFTLGDNYDKVHITWRICGAPMTANGQLVLDVPIPNFKVNHVDVRIVDRTSKHPSVMFDVTSYCRPATSNFVEVHWENGPWRNYKFQIFCTNRQFSAKKLLAELKRKTVRPPIETRRLIAKKLASGDEAGLASTPWTVALNCPLGKTRMSLPCRANACDHVQCFDAANYLRMNEMKAKWRCPVCNGQAHFKDLLIDGYFQLVLADPRVGEGDDDVVLKRDGSWEPIVSSAKRDGSHSRNYVMLPASPSPPGPSNQGEGKSIECVTLDDSDGEEVNYDDKITKYVGVQPPVEQLNPLKIPPEERQEELPEGHDDILLIQQFDRMPEPLPEQSEQLPDQPQQQPEKLKQQPKQLPETPEPLPQQHKQHPEQLPEQPQQQQRQQLEQQPEPKLDLHPRPDNQPKQRQKDQSRSVDGVFKRTESKDGIYKSTRSRAKVPRLEPKQLTASELQKMEACRVMLDSRVEPLPEGYVYIASHRCQSGYRFKKKKSAR